MSEILFISHRIPFPPDRGDKIRSHHILKRLAQIAPVHVATFADDDFDLAEEAELAALASTYKLVLREKPLILSGLQALATRRPVSLTAFHDRTLAAYIESVLATRPIAAIYVFSGQMGQYVPRDFKRRVIADFVDVDSAKFEAYAAQKNPLVSRLYAREAVLLRAEEARLAAQADISLLISAAEAELFGARLPADLPRSPDIRVLGNGINSNFYDPGVIGPETQLLDCPGPRIVFTGQMDYAPNVDAVYRAMDRIMPLIRRTLPEASFHVVCRNPKDSLLARHGRNGCHVWGRVNDMRTWLKGADMALIPLDIARGVQNKVLEAMAMALPVVLTPGAATGIGAVDGEDFQIAASDEELAAAAVALLTDHRRAQTMGLAARRFVTRNASWQSALAGLPQVMGWPGRAISDAA